MRLIRRFIRNLLIIELILSSSQIFAQNTLKIAGDLMILGRVSHSKPGITKHNPSLSSNIFVNFETDIAAEIKAGVCLKATFDLLEPPISMTHHIHFHSEAGQLEFGNHESIAAKIVTDGLHINRLVLKAFWLNILPPEQSKQYITSFSNFIDDQLQAKERNDPKINYYLPKLNNLQLGISYVPRLKPDHLSKMKTSEIIKALACGGSYQYNFSNTGSIKFAVLLEGGLKTNPMEEQWQLLGCNISGSLNYRSWLIAASYANYGKDTVINEIVNEAVQLAKVGISYKLNEAISMGGDYFESVYLQNKFKAANLTFNYQLQQKVEFFVVGGVYWTKDTFSLAFTESSFAGAVGVQFKL